MEGPAKNLYIAGIILKTTVFLQSHQIAIGTGLHDEIAQFE